MQVSKITFTGADDKTSIAHLEEASNYFPFVEWGILFPSAGASRFPSLKWVQGLLNTEMNLSAHLCGSLGANVLKGNIAVFAGIVGVDLFHTFDRIQLNFHGLPVIIDQTNFKYLVDKLPHEVIHMVFKNIFVVILVIVVAFRIN